MPPSDILVKLQGLSNEDKTMAFAVSVFLNRLRELPKEDRDDLFELMQAMQKSETREEVEECLRTMEEIITQAPVVIEEGLVDAPKAGDPLKKWKVYVAGKIKSLREAANMTQSELALKSGLQQSHISRLENATYSPTNVTLQRIADALGVPLSSIDPN